MICGSDNLDYGSEIFFLSDLFMHEANQILQLPDAILQAFQSALYLIKGNAELSNLVWECHLNWYVSEEGETPLPERAILERLMADQAGMFPAVVLLSGLPQTIEIYRAKGIPLDILTETLSDIEIWMQQYYKKHGVWGLGDYGWLRGHMVARVFKLGRLQFIHDPFIYPIHAFRSSITGQIIAFPNAGTRYRSDGLREGTNDIYDPIAGWTSILEITDKEIIGTPLSSLGQALQQTVCLPRTEWQLVLAEGVPVLHVHIPEGSKMTHELCRESYRMALFFYKKYLPELQVSAFSCGSWLLSPLFRNMLPDSSNIVLFLKDYYLIPIVTHDSDTLWRVFGEPIIEPTTAPRDTLLRQAILDQMAKGNLMYGGAGFIIREEAESEAYYSNLYVMPEEGSQR